MKSILLFYILAIMVVLSGAGLYQVRASELKRIQLINDFKALQNLPSDTRGIPTRINIPISNIDLLVKSAIVSGNSWTIHEDSASWLNTSGRIDKGNVVIYAHNKWQAFGKLRQLEVGDNIELYDDKGKVMYQIIETFEGTSDDLEFVTEQENRLTLYTCSGPFDSKRYFVFAKPKDKI